MRFETKFTLCSRSRCMKLLRGWHDDVVRARSTNIFCRVLIAALVIAAPIIGNPWVGTVTATTPAPPGASDSQTIASNPFIPEADLSDCVSSLPRPDCGTEQQSGYHQYLTFIVMLLATVFIGWRIARSVRSRDRQATPPPVSDRGRGH